MAICRATGMNYLELMSDDVPAYVVHDHIWTANAEAAHKQGGPARPTQDLMAQERAKVASSAE